MLAKNTDKLYIKSGNYIYSDYKGLDDKVYNDKVEKKLIKDIVAIKVKYLNIWW